VAAHRSTIKWLTSVVDPERSLVKLEGITPLTFALTSLRKNRNARKKAVVQTFARGDHPPVRMTFEEPCAVEIEQVVLERQPPSVVLLRAQRVSAARRIVARTYRLEHMQQLAHVDPAA